MTYLQPHISYHNCIIDQTINLNQIELHIYGTVGDSQSRPRNRFFAGGRLTESPLQTVIYDGDKWGRRLLARAGHALQQLRDEPDIQQADRLHIAGKLRAVLQVQRA